MKDETQRMALLSLNDGVVMPELSFYLDVGTGESCAAIEHAVKNHENIFVVSSAEDGTDKKTFCAIGVIAEIKQFVRLQNKNMRVLIQSMRRARLLDYTESDCVMCTVQPVSDIDDMDETEKEAVESLLRDKLDECYEAGAVKNNVLYREIRAFRSVKKLTDSMADYVKISDSDRQNILEEPNIRKRAMYLISAADEALSVRRIKKQVIEKISSENSKQQKKYVLREELAAIRKELGEDGAWNASDEFRERLEKLKLSPEVHDKIEKEINYFDIIPQNSAESSVAANYIEILLGYPWNISTEDNTDLNKAIDILEKDHYGLKEVKERIVDYLAVHILSNKGDLPIICLVGPPGTGKTSIAKSIARATNRKYVRMSLGGVHDEAEIRGHRKTYVGSMPGRIVQSIMKTKVNNPVILLDEIDKVGKDYRGDVASALLEVLDGEQNNEFNDHYMGVPVDLGNVLFIATANDVSNIPLPLLDRMELIQISGYTENEKYNIARLYLVSKVREKNGVASSQFRLGAGAIKEIIRHYTREAGVRELERNIDKVCRKACRMILAGESETVKVTKSNVQEFLGSIKYKEESRNLRDRVGIVHGLAWTAVGGVTLEIEVNIFPGSGQLQLTGKMGDVMKESACTGMSYIRSLDEALDLGEDYFSKHDFHIHIPEGAVPKDGPSAGITMATAMYSAIFGAPVRGKTAMTGEITLRGDVLPIGGLKEKLLAAGMAGMKTVLIPADNEPDYEELDEDVRGAIKVVPVENMRQVLDAALARQ